MEFNEGKTVEEDKITDLLTATGKLVFPTAQSTPFEL
jgi:hypothetical protein